MQVKALVWKIRNGFKQEKQEIRLKQRIIAHYLIIYHAKRLPITNSKHNKKNNSFQHWIL